VLKTDKDEWAVRDYDLFEVVRDGKSWWEHLDDDEL